MTQAEIEARAITFVSRCVVPTANEVRALFSNLSNHREFYVLNGYNIGGANEIADGAGGSVDPFWMTALEFHQWHDLIVQIGNFSSGNPVNGGNAFRYRLFYERIQSSGFVVSVDSTGDPILNDQRKHIIKAVSLADSLAKSLAHLEEALNFHISNNLSAVLTTALLTANNFRFTDADYSNWIFLAEQAVNMANNRVVVPGNYLDTNVRIVDANV